MLKRQKESGGIKNLEILGGIDMDELGLGGNCKEVREFIVEVGDLSKGNFPKRNA